MQRWHLCLGGWKGGGIALHILLLGAAIEWFVNTTDNTPCPSHFTDKRPETNFA